MNSTLKQSKEEIGNRIRELRINLGMSQDDLAKAVGYTSENSRSTINKIEKGCNDIAQSKLPLYAKALHTSVGYLLGVDEQHKLEIKDILKNRRLTLRLTLADVAKYVGVSEGTVSRWESGDISNMRRDKIALLSKVLQMSPLIIMGYAEEKPGSEFSKQTHVLQPDEEKLLKFYSALNSKGKTKAIDFLEDLVQIPSYKQEVYVVKKAARNGEFEELTLTSDDVEKIKNLPDVDDL